MVSWESFKECELEKDSDYVKTNIRCPKCDKPIYMDKSIVLTSYPAQYRYYCSCGWSGTSFNSWINNIHSEEKK